MNMANGKDDWTQVTRAHDDKAGRKIVIWVTGNDGIVPLYIRGASEELKLQFTTPNIRWKKVGNTHHFKINGEVTIVEAPEGMTISKFW